VPVPLRGAGYPHSLGKAYSAVTSWLGFRPESDEGKTMGLAAYGDPDAAAARFTRGLVRADARRLVRLDTRAFGFPWGERRLFGDAFVRALGPPRAEDAALRPGDADAARGIQDAVVEVTLAAARRLLAETGAGHLGLAGGLFLNCALNGALARALQAEVLPFPVAGDAGAAWGAAAEVHRRLTGHAAAPLETLELGTDLGAAGAHDVRGAAGEAPADLADAVACRIAAGGLVGVARGRAELGPRALGARSLLASPTTTASRDRVNAHKGREAWRPLAPVVRDPVAAGAPCPWFRDLAPSPWMILTVEATPRGRAEIPGAVHADGTARVQTADPRRHPFLWAVLERLEAHGHPAALLNTSLNRRGEPLVDTAAQALAAARAMRLDALVLGDRVLDLEPGAPTT
jgi:carbamoyltransferase